MFNLNKVFLAGNLTRDVELKTLQSGTVVGNFSVAINNRRSDGQDDTVFVEVTCWNKTAENCAKFIGKGSNVFIDGRLDMDTWQGQDGKKNTKLKVTALSVQFVSRRNADEQPQESAPAQPYPQSYCDESRRGIYAQPRSAANQGYGNAPRQNQGINPAYGPETGGGELPPF